MGRGRLRVLVVEDHADARETMERLLARRGHEVRAVGTVAEGVASLDWPPQVILLDLMLPDGTGLDVVRELKRRDLAPMRIAILSAAMDLPELTEDHYVPVPAIFRKPFAVDKLMEWVEGRQ